MRYGLEHQLGLSVIWTLLHAFAPRAALAASVFGTVIWYLASKRPPLTSARFPLPRSTFDRSTLPAQACLQLSARNMKSRFTFTDAHVSSNAWTSRGRK